MSEKISSANHPEKPSNPSNGKEKKDSKMPSVLGSINLIYGGIFFFLTVIQLISRFSEKMLTPTVVDEKYEAIIEISKELNKNVVVKLFTIFNSVAGMALYLLLFLAGIYLIKRVKSGLTLSRISSIGILILTASGILFSTFYYMPHFKALAEDYGIQNVQRLISTIKISSFVGEICFLFYPVVLLVLTFSKTLRDSLTQGE